MNNTIVELSQKLKSGDISSVELTKNYLSRAKSSDLNAYITIDEEGANEAARKADSIIKSGKAQQLTGIPFGIKDAISTKGMRTTAGSKILDDYIPPYSATVIEKLRAQVAIIIGKNNMDEFAMGSSTENSAYGPTLNPHDKTKVPGGSSGGSASAVSADLCVASLGSDTGGSIRQPAAFCGVVGFKPTYGRVSRYGLIAMASSLDQIGPITKTATDAKTVFEAISGHDSSDATSINTDLSNAKDIKQLRVGVIREHIQSEHLDVGVKDAVQSGITQLEKLGCRIEEIDLPSADEALAIYYIIMPVEVSSNLARFDGIKYGSSALKEMSLRANEMSAAIPSGGDCFGVPRNDNDAKLSLLDVYLKTRSKYFGSEAKRRIILGAYASSAGYFDAYYKKAIQAKNKLQNDFASIFEKVDVIVGPTTPTPAFGLGEKSADPMQMYVSDVFTVPANLAGLPSISVPVASEGLPVGLQLTGPADSDLTVLDLAIALENCCHPE